MKVAFIGMGIMGSRMAARLISPEIQLTVFNRDKSKTAMLETLGASVASNISEAVVEAEFVFTMLSNPEAVSEVSNEVLASISKDAVWIDSSTISPNDVLKNQEKASKLDKKYLEAPVAGTKQPAENGELVFFVGGEKSNLDAVATLLERMGKKNIYMGDHGKAASIKLLVNLLLAQSMLAYSEAVKLGTSLGLEKETVQNILLNTPVTAPFLNTLRTKLDSEDTSANFPLELMLKDLNLVQSMTADLGIQLPSASLTSALYKKVTDLGKGREDFSTIYLETLKD